MDFSFIRIVNLSTSLARHQSQFQYRVLLLSVLLHHFYLLPYPHYHFVPITSNHYPRSILYLCHITTFSLFLSFFLSCFRSVILSFFFRLSCLGLSRPHVTVYCLTLPNYLNEQALRETKRSEAKACGGRHLCCRCCR